MENSPPQAVFEQAVSDNISEESELSNLRSFHDEFKGLQSEISFVVS